MSTFDVDLYESNAGDLFLHPMNSDWVYETQSYANFGEGSCFAEESKVLCENEAYARQDWSTEWVHSYTEMLPSLQHPETHLIATWHNDAPITYYLARPGRAGERYLNLPRA